MKHPLSLFSYCPVCGSGNFAEDSFKSKHCGHCGFTFFANAAASTAAFIVRNGRLLVARRAKEPARGTLDLPGGFVDMGETAEEGMRRELREETGLDARSMDYLFSLPNRYEFSGMTIHTLDLFFEVGIAPEAEPEAADDAAELLWLPLQQLQPEQFGLQSISRAVELFLSRVH
jgi:ADP-ribose pyrophosphatase